MAVLLRNNAVSRLASSLTAAATTLAVTSGEGARFPSPTGGDWFPVSVIKANGSLEIMRCTARSGDVLTVTRAQESTAAMAFDAGDRVELRATAGVFGEGQQLTAAAQASADAAQASADAAQASADAKQPSDALLASIAALTTASGKFMAFAGADAAESRDIVGTVSQSAGIPTGAIIESGSNANGEYVRFADGTQICLGGGTAKATTAISNLYGSTSGTIYYTNVTLSLPAVFVGTFRCTPSAAARGHAVYGIPNDPGSVLVQVRYGDTTSDLPFVYIAIGRWY